MERHWRAIEQASQLGELAIAAIQHYTCLAVGSVIVVDQRGEFAKLVLKQGEIWSRAWGGLVNRRSALVSA